MKTNKLGYRCPDCNRFLVDPVSNTITCSYSNCFFSGKIDSLKKMRQPSNPPQIQVVNIAPSADVELILGVIKDQINTLQYTSVNCTVKQKTFVYQSFINLLGKYPEEMSKYLLEGKRGDKLQSKLFQEYVSILNASLPFSYKSGKKLISVDSMTHVKFNPFDGLSKFDAVIESNGTIKNKTSEIYIGNRKSYYCQPFYIGKLLDVVGDNGNSLLKNVTDYSFSIIKTNLPPGSPVHVSHLRIPAHYQVGILSHINRIKKNITNSLTEKSN